MKGLISVVMPAYNSIEFIGEAIQSILNQTYKEFEFIIINDGSTDNTEAEILKFKDERIIYLKNGKNLGNNATRNMGMKHAKGKYVAIADSDDISVSSRFEKQVRFLDENPDISAVGSWLQWFGDTKKVVEKFSNKPELIAAKLFFGNAVAQPSIMLRKEDFEKNRLTYDVKRENMGDYHLWYRASLLGLKITHLQEVLVKYRISNQQIRNRNAEDREKKLSQFFKERILDARLSWHHDEIDFVFSFIREKQPLSRFQYSMIMRNLNQIEQCPILQKRYDTKAWKEVNRWQKLRAARYLFQTEKTLGTGLNFLKTFLS